MSRSLHFNSVFVGLAFHPAPEAAYANLNTQIGLELGRLLEQSFLTRLTEKDANRSEQNKFDLSTFRSSVNLNSPSRHRLRVRTRFSV